MAQDPPVFGKDAIKLREQELKQVIPLPKIDVQTRVHSRSSPGGHK